MARIPTVTAQTSPFAGTIDVQASPESFGAQIGAAKIGLGNAIGQLGSAVTSTAERFSAEAKKTQGEADQMAVASAMANPISNFDQQYNEITLNSTGNSSPDVYNAFMKSTDDNIKTLGLTGDVARQYKLNRLRYAPTYTAQAIEYDRVQKIKLGIDEFQAGTDAQINSVRNGGGAETTSPGVDPVTKKPLPSRYDIALKNGVDLISSKPIDRVSKEKGITKFKSDLAEARFEALGNAALSSKTDAPHLADNAIEDFRTNPRWKTEMTPEAYDRSLQKLINVQKQSRVSIEQRIKVNLQKFNTMASGGYATKIDPKEVADLGRMVNEYGDVEDQANLGTLETKLGIANETKDMPNSEIIKKRDGYTGAAVSAAPAPAGNAQAFLLQRLIPAHRNQPYYITQMNPQLQSSLASLIQSAPPEIQKGLVIVSGARSVGDQQRVINEAGGVSGRVAGTNGPHVRGVAADLGWRGARGTYLPPQVAKWLFDNAPKFGLRISPQAPPGTHNFEPHHIELVDAGGNRLSGNYRGPGGGDGNTMAGGTGTDMITVGAAGTPVSYRPMFEATAKYGAGMPALLASMGAAESQFNPNARSPAGAMGIMQFMPETARRWGVNPNDPASSIDGAGRLMQHLMTKYAGKSKGGYDATALAVAAYNAGEGRVDQWLIGRGNLPHETQNYVAKVLGGQAGGLAGSETGMGVNPMVDASSVPGGAPNKYMSWSDFVAAQTYQQIIDANDTAMKNDFMVYAASKGMDVASVIDPTTSAMADDAQWKERGNDYLTARDTHKPDVTAESPYPDFFTQDEMKGIEKIIQGNDEGAQLDLMRHIASMDERAQAAARAQIGEKNAATAYIGAMVNRDPRTAESAFHGVQLLKDQNVDIMGRMGGKAALSRSYDTLVGGSFSRFPVEMQGALEQTVFALMAAETSNSVASDVTGEKVDVNTVMMTKMIEQATGLKAGTVNGVTTFLLPDVAATDVNRIVSNATPQTLVDLSKTGKPPLTVDGVTHQTRPMTTDELDVSTLQPASLDGRVFVRMEDGQLAYTSDLDEKGVPRPYVMVLTPDKVKTEIQDIDNAELSRGGFGLGKFLVNPKSDAVVTTAPPVSPDARTGVTGLGSTAAQPEPPEEPVPTPAPAGSTPPSALPPASPAPASPQPSPVEPMAPAGTGEPAQATPYLPPYMTTPTGQPSTTPPFGDPTGKPYEPQPTTRAGGPEAVFSPGSGTATAVPEPAPEPAPVPAKPTAKDYPYEPKAWKKALVKGGMGSKEADKYVEETTKEWRASAGSGKTAREAQRENYRQLLIQSGVEDGTPDMERALAGWDKATKDMKF